MKNEKKTKKKKEETEGVKKNKGGRPTKLTDKFLNVAEEVVNDDINAIILTDEELVDEINDKLQEKERITYRTLRNWKDKNKKDKELDEIGKRFFPLIKKALIKQKKHLFDKFRNEPNQWQKWAWIIERKFDDWNIKQKHEHSGDAEQPLLVKFINGDTDTK
jgi:hypothetical protein